MFSDSRLNYDNLERIYKAVGKERLVLDLSCRKKNDKYYIVTDRWQRFTDEIVNEEFMHKLAGYCDEFLIHAVDVEGKNNGIERELVKILGRWCKVIRRYRNIKKIFRRKIRLYYWKFIRLVWWQDKF